MRVVATVLAIAVGVIVLLGYFYPAEPLLAVRLELTNWAMIIAGVAVIVGVVNLVSVQTEKIRARQKNAAYSGILVLSLIITFGVGLVFGPEFLSPAVNAVIIPVEASLMAILAVTLIYASIRLLRRRVDVMSIVFLAVAVISLIVAIPTPLGPALGDSLRAFVGIFSSGGARGLLIGIALGTLLTGLRVLFGVDRPYGGN
jgi:hypothetical protein